MPILGGLVPYFDVCTLYEFSYSMVVTYAFVYGFMTILLYRYAHYLLDDTDKHHLFDVSVFCQGDPILQW